MREDRLKICIALAEGTLCTYKEALLPPLLSIQFILYLYFNIAEQSLVAKPATR